MRGRNQGRQLHNATGRLDLATARISACDPFLPRAEGLYDPTREKDSCGVGFVADMADRKSHRIIEQGLEILANLDHRGAVGGDPTMGDGCGILIQIPHGFFAEECGRLGIELPARGHYGVGHLFMPRDPDACREVEEIVTEAVTAEGLQLLGWREVPVLSEDLSPSVAATEPRHRQIFVGAPKPLEDKEAFERQLFLLRKVVSNAVYTRRDPRLDEFYPVCLSSRTIVYKGMVLVGQLGRYYRDLADPRVESSLALVHQRFATNTFPSWRLAHPYRFVAHNGEINTLRGNVNWMAARQASVDSDLFGNDISKLWPISYEGQSDTACFDNALEFLLRGGYSLAHAMMMLVPEAWAGNPLMNEDRRAFYEYHAALMEPWDGPASLVFTDGRQIGAMLDRNGLRPARYLVTEDGLVVLASEMGVLPIPEETIIEKWRLQPGRMLLIDLEKGRIVADEEIKRDLAAAHPYKNWLRRTQIVLEDLREVQPRQPRTDVSLLDRQQAFGYTQEDLKLLMQPMAVTGQEAVGSMGTDTPISAISHKSKLLYTYFKQNFAQVTNPPIDPIREELVMSLVSFIGPRPNILDLEGTSRKKRLEVRQPILTNEDLEKIRSIGHFEEHFDTKTIDITYASELGAAGLEGALDRLCDRAEAAVHGGYNIIVLSDRAVGPDRIPIPALLATAAVHHHLIRKGLRTSVGLVLETGEVREVHHFACLAGYGAEAINPYLAFETLFAIKEDMPPEVSDDEIVYRYIKSIDKGLLKVMSKMGISTYQSYCGAQIFDAVGLKSELIREPLLLRDRRATIEGRRPRRDRRRERSAAIPTRSATRRCYRQCARRSGASTPSGCAARRTPGRPKRSSAVAARGALATVSRTATGPTHGCSTSRPSELLRPFEASSASGVRPRRTAARSVPLDEVEPAKRDREALLDRRHVVRLHLARGARRRSRIAMNRIGGKSNTGEGGEEADRYRPSPERAIPSARRSSRWRPAASA